MLVARDAVLASGLYAPIADAVAEAASPALHGPSAALIDLGSGTGHYSGVVAAHARSRPRMLMADRSPAAVRWSMLAERGSDGVVLDTWAPLPIRDAVADVVLDVFAPRNPPEFARILRPGGRLIVVVPRPEHLRELRTGGRMLDVPGGKATAVLEQFSGLLHALEPRHIHAIVRPTPAQAAALHDMGPSAHHGSPEDGHSGADDTNGTDHANGTARTVDGITVSVDVLTFVAR
ncbi:hypothetical protein [Agromyces archimandritae]|uniref:Methyltransferase domain-containing protein n=1 Tax=Agromyces archimandritae TaxID=2781962 RepID=A0A975FNL2_9MICO|nr:hypothetical protein [Agromyces archimandritae]QTX04798.1 hypothetical protein G127AT_00530 [Agromyces archimandritae]